MRLVVALRLLFASAPEKINSNFSVCQINDQDRKMHGEMEA